MDVAHRYVFIMAYKYNESYANVKGKTHLNYGEFYLFSIFISASQKEVMFFWNFRAYMCSRSRWKEIFFINSK